MLKTIICMLVFVGSLIQSAEIDRGIALKVAKSIYVQNKPESLDEVFRVKKLDIIYTDNQSPLLYIFNLSPSGFVVISAEDHTVPCLGYSYKSNFKLDGMPKSLQSIFDGYKNDIIYARHSNAKQDNKIKAEWNFHLSENPSYEDSRNVNPLIDAEFDQGGSWNNYIQSEIGFNGPVGCVAVAMSQVMHYWKYPYIGEGSNSYVENNYGLIEIDFGSSYYDFDNMPDTYPSTAAQILLFHTGVAVNMDYDNSGSGAWVMGSYPSSEYAMEHYFKYNESIYHIYKSSNNANEFRDAILSELDDSKPVIMVGYGSGYGGGHAWNIDGYQGTSFHCNWGWGGYSNGYFNLTTMGGFPDDQAVLLNIIPRDIETPIALFEYTIDASTVMFIDLSEMVNEYELRNWHWDFGDGTAMTTSTGNIDYTFGLSGTYNIELVVENIYGMMSEPFVESISVSSASPGDLTQDDNVDVLDVVLMVNYILGDTPSDAQLFIGDLNSDGILNIQDLVLLVAIILAG